MNEINSSNMENDIQKMIECLKLQKIDDVITIKNYIDITYDKNLYKSTYERFHEFFQWAEFESDRKDIRAMVKEMLLN